MILLVQLALTNISAKPNPIKWFKLLVLNVHCNSTINRSHTCETLMRPKKAIRKESEIAVRLRVAVRFQTKLEKPQRSEGQLVSHVAGLPSHVTVTWCSTGMSPSCQWNHWHPESCTRVYTTVDKRPFFSILERHCPPWTDSNLYRLPSRISLSMISKACTIRSV